ncbi:unnamed protein product [Brassica oleracea]
MEEDHSHSPVVSKYAAQLYGSTSHSNSTTGEPVHATSPTRPQLNSQHTPLCSKSNYSPSSSPCSAIYDASAHPNSPEAITPHPPPSLSQPKYDTSCNQSSQRQIFPLSPLHLTPELDSLPGFVGHATAINAFSATATSKPSSVPNTKPYSALQVCIIPLVSVYAQPTEDSDIVSLSDGSPAPETPKNIPSMEENHLAKQLLRCKTVHAPELLSPLPQIEWDLFEKIISKFSAA